MARRADGCRKRHEGHGADWPAPGSLIQQQGPSALPREGRWPCCRFALWQLRIELRWGLEGWIATQ
jgi:hypothetical protein